MTDETVTIKHQFSDYTFEVSYNIVEAEDEYNIAERVDFIAIWYDGKDFTDFASLELKSKLEEVILKNK